MVCVIGIVRGARDGYNDATAIDQDLANFFEIIAARENRNYKR